jgi:hypothetical protein
MREMKQLRNNSKKPPISRHACHLIAVKAADTASIQDLDFVYKSFSGNRTRLGVTYPAVRNTSASIKASNLLPGVKTSVASQDTDKPATSDKKVKEKHACKGQNSCKGKGGCKSSDNGCKGKNSCKGKGGCATDGSKMPE